MLRSKFMAAAVLSTLCVSASATVYQYLGPQASFTGGEPGRSAISQLLFQYNDQTQQLSFSSTWNATAGTPNAFWLVLSGGAYPNETVQQYPIYYVDFRETSNRVMAYAYAGNYYSFFDQSRYLASFDNVVNVQNAANGDRTASFSINLGGINSARSSASGWLGGGFGRDGATDDIGVWMHYFQQNSTHGLRYTGTGADARLSGLTYVPGTLGWVDFAGQNAVPCTPSGGSGSGAGGAGQCTPTPCTNGSGSGSCGQVPEPGMLFILGLGLVSLAALRRRAPAAAKR